MWRSFVVVLMTTAAFAGTPNESIEQILGKFGKDVVAQAVQNTMEKLHNGEIFADEQLQDPFGFIKDPWDFMQGIIIGMQASTATNSTCLKEV